MLTSKNLVQVKGMFFDRALMDKTMDRTKLKFLSKAGAFVMTRARQSIRPSKKESKSGEPPRAHGKKLLKRNIFFGLDKAADTTLVGPIRLNQPTFAVEPTSGPVPSILEHSGTVRIHEVFKLGKWRPMRPGDTGLPVRTRSHQMQARPFMQPALDHESKNFPAMLAGTFTK